MASDLRDQLQSILGTSYQLQHELGGGGMSRVFLAHESALGRDVVVKVLHPELASGVNTDRFKREIQLAAQLQHPHIVPILSAGETEGLPFFTMPYVAGRSLRDRLADPVPLAIDEIVDVLRDVARALTFAHGRGVIHRDIKPDNVLLAQGAATVTDFGVAKAVTAARAEGGTSTLTSIGTSIGTPMYMAPEQAAADPDTDHRADIYAWGVMAYELLAGRPPFTQASSHKLLVAHMSEMPAPVTDHRPDCPPGLAALVMQCLAKDPADRPQAATELLQRIAEPKTSSSVERETLPAIRLATRRTLLSALGVYAAAFVLVTALAQTTVTMIGLPDWVLPGALVLMALGLPVVLFTAFAHHGARVARAMVMRTPGGGVTGTSAMTRIAVKASPYLTWRRTAVGGATAVGVFAALVVAFMVLRALGIGPVGSLLAKGVIKDSDQILIADFESPVSDSALGDVVSEGIRTGLSQSRRIHVVQQSAILPALARMEMPATTRLTLPVAKQLAEREGYEAIVDGKIALVGSSYIVTARLLAANGDQIWSDQVSAKDATDLIPAMDRIARALRGKVGESLRSVRETMTLEKATTTSLPALRKFTEGVRYNGEQQYALAIPALEEAIRLDTNFALAYRLASLVYNNARQNPERADTLRQRAFALRDRLPDLERLQVEGNYYSAGSHADRPKALAAYLQLLAIDSTIPQALNGSAIIYDSWRSYAKAESMYVRAQKAHPEIAFHWANDVVPLLGQAKLDEALAVDKEFVKRFPKSPQASLPAVQYWGARHDFDSVAAIAQRDLRSPSSTVRQAGLGILASVAAIRGQLHEFLSLNERARAENGIGPTDSVRSVLDSSFLDAWYGIDARRAERRVDALLGKKALRDVPGRPYLDVLAVYALAGAPEKARATLAAYDNDVRDTARVRLESWRRHAALGEIAMAQHKYDDAIREFWKSDTMYDGEPHGCEPCTLAAVAKALDLAGRTDQSIAAFERVVSSTYSYAFRDVDPNNLAGAYKRLGELYEQKGETERAASYYSKFVDLWRTADPELQPKVAEVRKRLAALSAHERR